MLQRHIAESRKPKAKGWHNRRHYNSVWTLIKVDRSGCLCCTHWRTDLPPPPVIQVQIYQANYISLLSGSSELNIRIHLYMNEFIHFFFFWMLICIFLFFCLFHVCMFLLCILPTNIFLFFLFYKLRAIMYSFKSLNTHFYI